MPDPYEPASSDPGESANLRGWSALVTLEGRPRRVTVVTHTRGDLWLVEGPGLPKWCERADRVRRVSVLRRQLSGLVPPKEAS